MDSAGGHWKRTSRQPGADGRKGSVITAIPAVATNVYRLFVYLYPPAFRREFGSEMACDFEDATRDAWRDGRWLAVLPLWIDIGCDLAWTVTAQWLRNGLPVVTVLSALGTTMFSFAVTGFLWRSFRSVSPHPRNEDEVVLLVLATMVVLLSAAVITFTVCVWLLGLGRNSRARRLLS